MPFTHCCHLFNRHKPFDAYMCVIFSVLLIILHLSTYVWHSWYLLGHVTAICQGYTVISCKTSNWGYVILHMLLLQYNILTSQLQILHKMAFLAISLVLLPWPSYWNHVKFIVRHEQVPDNDSQLITGLRNIKTPLCVRLVLGQNAKLPAV
jgi:hypothetical protein